MGDEKNCAARSLCGFSMRFMRSNPQYSRSAIRKVKVIKGGLTIKEKIELIYEKQITPFGNSAKVDAPKKYRGKRAYVIIVKN